MNTMFVATVSLFLKEGKETDKNGNPNLFLTLVAGKMPNKAIVLNGTQALRQEIYPGDTVLFNCVEGDVHADFGRQFNVTKLATLSAFEIMDAPTKLGNPQIIDVSVEATTE